MISLIPTKILDKRKKQAFHDPEMSRDSSHALQSKSSTEDPPKPQSMVGNVIPETEGLHQSRGEGRSHHQEMTPSRCRIERYNLIFEDGHSEVREQLLDCPRGTPSSPCQNPECVQILGDRIATRKENDEYVQRTVPTGASLEEIQMREKPKSKLQNLGLDYNKRWRPFSSQKWEKERKKKPPINARPNRSSDLDTVIERVPRAPSPPPAWTTKPQEPFYVPAEPRRERGRLIDRALIGLKRRQAPIIIPHPQNIESKKSRKHMESDSESNYSSSEDDEASSERVRPYRRPSRSPSPGRIITPNRELEQERSRRYYAERLTERARQIEQAERDARLRAEQTAAAERREQRRIAYQDRLRLEAAERGFAALEASQRARDAQEQQELLDRETIRRRNMQAVGLTSRHPARVRPVSLHHHGNQMMEAMGHALIDRSMDNAEANMRRNAGLLPRGRDGRGRLMRRNTDGAQGRWRGYWRHHEWGRYGGSSSEQVRRHQEQPRRSPEQVTVIEPMSRAPSPPLARTSPTQQEKDHHSLSRRSSTPDVESARRDASNERSIHLSANEDSDRELSVRGMLGISPPDNCSDSLSEPDAEVPNAAGEWQPLFPEAPFSDDGRTSSTMPHSSDFALSFEDSIPGQTSQSGGRSFTDVTTLDTGRSNQPHAVEDLGEPVVAEHSLSAITVKWPPPLSKETMEQLAIQFGDVQGWHGEVEKPEKWTEAALTETSKTTPTANKDSPLPIPTALSAVDQQTHAQRLKYEIIRDALYNRSRNICHWTLNGVGRWLSQSYYYSQSILINTCNRMRGCRRISWTCVSCNSRHGNNPSANSSGIHES